MASWGSRLPPESSSIQKTPRCPAMSLLVTPACASKSESNATLTREPASTRPSECTLATPSGPTHNFALDATPEMAIIWIGLLAGFTRAGANVAPGRPTNSVTVAPAGGCICTLYR
jgi:hypothetical protein